MTAFPEWSVESLRCTSFFRGSPSDVAGITWWEDVVGAEPSDVALRRTKAFRGGRARLNGPL